MTVESETGGDLSSSETTGKNETDLVDLYEPEEWDGPDLFGEYSPEQEARITPPAAPAMDAVPAGRPHRQTGRTVGRVRRLGPRRRTRRLPPVG